MLLTPEVGGPGREGRANARTYSQTKVCRDTFFVIRLLSQMKWRIRANAKLRQK